MAIGVALNSHFFYLTAKQLNMNSPDFLNKAYVPIYFTGVM